MFTVNADLFRNVHSMISKEETRYYLQGVFIQRGVDGVGAYLVATDGHRMLVAFDAEAVLAGDFPETGVIVKLDAPTLKACKAGRRETNHRLVKSSGAGEPLSIINGDTDGIEALAANWQIDGSFPDWQRVLPATPSEPSLSIGVNAAYVATFGAVAKELTGTPNVAVTGNANAPLLITFSDPRVFGVLMPVRWDASTTLPDWLVPTETAQAA